MFSRREWLMLVAILLMAEAWILNISYAFKGDQDVINYISFAATIASLLLAVLAIIYGFYQADAQKRSTATIEYQLESMRSVQRKISGASSDLVAHLAEVKSMTAAVASMSSLIETQHEKLGSLEGGLASIEEKQDQLQQAIAGGKHSPSSDSLDVAERFDAVRRILTRTSFQCDLVGYALSRAFRLSGTREIDLWRFVSKFVASPLDGLHATSKGEWLSFSLQILQLLQAFDFVELELDDDPAKSKVRISEPMLEKLNQLASDSVVAKSPGSAEARAKIDHVTWDT
jgi:hypothetical protein